MATAVSNYQADLEIDTLVSEEVESTAMVLAGTVAIEKITDTASFRRVTAAGIDAASNIKNIEALFEPICQQRYTRWKKATSTRAEKLAPFEVVKSRASLLVGSYNHEQERLRRAEEARIQEQLRVEAEAEAKRQSDENAIQDAIELEAQGDKKGAEAVLNNPAPVAVHVPAVVLPTQVPKAEGVSGSKIWRFRITNEAEIPREYLMVDEKKLGQIVRALKDKTNIAGIEAYPENGARFRA